jgi:hypothetical protein
MGICSLTVSIQLGELVWYRTGKTTVEVGLRPAASQKQSLMTSPRWSRALADTSTFRVLPPRSKAPLSSVRYRSFL